MRPPAPPPARLALLAFCACCCGLGACEPAPRAPSPANTPPVLRFLQPAGESPVRAGTPVTLEVSVEDAEDGAALGERVLWVSSGAGQFAHGTRATITFAEPGEQVLTATVVDSGAESASASLTLRVLGGDAPVAAVRKPTVGQTFNQGEVLELECEALTVAGVRLRGGAVQWTSALSGPLPSGDVVRTALVVAGEDTLTCSAGDPETGARSTASVRVNVRPIVAPAVLITQPEATEVFVKQGAVVPYSPTVVFRATAQDFNSGGGAGSLDASIQWTLEPGGLLLGAGASVSHTFTEPGTYTVMSRVVDSLGHTAVDSVQVQLVANLPPRCEIDQPRGDGARLLMGTSTKLKGRCVDPETGRALPPVWRTSTSTTPLGEGQELDVLLTVNGAQVLSACAADPEAPELSGCAEQSVRTIVNSAPTACGIQSPTKGASASAGKALLLQGVAVDPEDPQSDLRYVWTSSKDGPVGRGASTTTLALTTPGAHALTLTVTDPWGLACATTTEVVVNGAPQVKVDGVMQGARNCLLEPCVEGQKIIATGSARDVDSQGDNISALAWLDSLVGGLAPDLLVTFSTTLSAPERGRHTLVLRAIDHQGAVGRSAVSFSVLPDDGSRRTLLEGVANTTSPVMGLALTESGLLYVDGVSSAVVPLQPSVGTLDVGGPALALFRLVGKSGEVIYVGTEGQGVQRCQGGDCQRFFGGPLRASNNIVTAVVALESPDLLLMGTRNGLVFARASDPSAGGKAGILAGRRVLPGREVRQLALAPVNPKGQLKVWAATSEGLAEVTVRVDGPFEAANTSVSTVLHVPPEIPDEDVLSVAVGPEGQVFAGTHKGFSALGEKGPALLAPPWNLASEEIRALLFERQDLGTSTRDVLWAGTPAGLLRYDLAQDVVTSFGTAEGLLSLQVLSLEPGPPGTRYIGTTRGVSSYTGH